MRALVLLAVVAGATPAAAEPGLPLPRGCRADGDRFRCRADLRATTSSLERAWRRSRLEVRKIGPVSRGGVEVVRYLPATARPWRAVHVYRVAGVTWISVVPLPLDAPAPTE